MAKIISEKQNILDLIPIQNEEWGKKADGTVFLKKRRFKNTWINKMMEKCGIPLYYCIYLDEFGSFVWNHCDGLQPIYQIAQSLYERFGEKVDPVYERLGAFMRLLAYQKLISYKVNPD